MPELTVSMPAYNTGKYIREAIESVLCQDGPDFELIVVDDGSLDNTSEIVESFEDPRVRLIRNQRNMGIAHCHNLVIEQCDSPFIVHVDSDDVVLPGGFRKMVGTLKGDLNIGQGHCHYFYMDKNGRASRAALLKRQQRLLKTRPPDMDYKWHLLVRGTVINALRTYRKEIFKVVGKFNEELRHGVDYEMALRIIDKYEIRIIPEFLYCVRKHKQRTTGSSPFKNLIFYVERLMICRRLLKAGEVQFMREKKYRLAKLMFIGLFYVLGLGRLRDLVITSSKNLCIWV